MLSGLVIGFASRGLRCRLDKRNSITPDRRAAPSVFRLALEDNHKRSCSCLRSMSGQCEISQLLRVSSCLAERVIKYITFD
jgi:hypothetical protein